MKNPGNWRPGSILILEDGTGEAAQEGRDIEMVPGLIEERIESLNIEFPNDAENCPPAWFKVAMAPLNLVTIHPFSDGHGRMARGPQALVLGMEGILEPEFSSSEEYRRDLKAGVGCWTPDPR